MERSQGSNGSSEARLNKNPSIYWAAPYRNEMRNGEARLCLAKYGVEAAIPLDLVSAQGRNGETLSPKLIRQVCMQAIRDCDATVVDLSTYGLDAAWEIGFSEAIGKPVLGMALDEEALVRTRTVNRRHAYDNSMHGWDEKVAANDLASLAQMTWGKAVLTCRSFSNERALEEIRHNTFIDTEHHVLTVAKDILPGHLSCDARDTIIQLLDSHEVLLVPLPRYGMDTAWLIGYADGLEKVVIGWMTDDDERPIEQASLCEHWTHAWSKKPTVSSWRDLADAAWRLHANRPSRAGSIF